MKVNDIKLLDVIKDVQEAVDVENLAHRIDYHAHDVLENDEGVAAEDNLNWFFYAHYNEVDAEETNELAISNAASEPENNCLYRDAELLKYRHLKCRSYFSSSSLMLTGCCDARTDLAIKFSTGRKRVFNS